MESFIRRDAEFKRLYNCSFYNVSDVPLEQRANVPMGALIFGIAFIEEGVFFQSYIHIVWVDVRYQETELPTDNVSSLKSYKSKHWHRYADLFYRLMISDWMHQQRKSLK